MPDRDREAPEPPRMVIGWKCRHLSLTAGPHVDLSGQRPSCGHGCTMHPEYARATS